MIPSRLTSSQALEAKPSKDRECIGEIAGLWRYPVKSMQGEPCDELALDQAGIQGDRRAAFESSGAPIGKPLLRSNERAAMLRFAARLRESEIVVHAGHAPERLVDDHRLLAEFPAPDSEESYYRLRVATRPLTDVRPVAVHSIATERAFADALGRFDGRRLRSNVILRLFVDRPFGEDDLSGETLLLGEGATLQMLERIPRCRMVSLHPETAEPDPSVLRWLAHHRNGRAGIYARPLGSGTIRVGDGVCRLRP